MTSFLLLSLIASVMVGVIVYTLYLTSYKVKTYVGLYVIYFILIMMVTMFIGALLYLFSPSDYSLAEAIIVNNATMLFLLIYLFTQGKKLARKRGINLTHTTAISSLVVLNEILMGATFSLADFGISYFQTFYEAFVTTTNNYWFFYPMMAEMLSLYLIDYIKGKVKKEFFPLIGITTFPPAVFDFSQWIYSSIVISLILCFLGILNSSKR